MAGPDPHIAFMKNARSIYRFRVLEGVLLGCVAFFPIDPSGRGIQRRASLRTLCALQTGRV